MKISAITLIAALFLTGIVAVASAQTLTSDQPDYEPGSTATLTGAGFAPGETVTLQVLHADGTPNTGTDHQPWTVVASGSGGFVTTWHVCTDDCLGSQLRATAVGSTSGQHADALFTDNVAVTLNWYTVNGTMYSPTQPSVVTSLPFTITANITYSSSVTASTIAGFGFHDPGANVISFCAQSFPFPNGSLPSGTDLTATVSVTYPVEALGCVCGILSVPGKEFVLRVRNAALPEPIILRPVLPITFQVCNFTVSGSVLASCPAAGTGLLGVTVDAYQVGSGDLVGTAVTDATGAYTIPDLPGGSSYTITVVTPLGYAATTPEVQVDNGDSPVNFSLSCVQATGTPQSMGFWKHNVGVATGGKGAAQIDATTLCSYLDLIAVHFNNNAINPVVVYQPPASGGCPAKLEVARTLLDLQGNATMIARAKQMLLSLLLNVAAGKISQTAVISADGATVSQAITYCDNLIDNPAGNYERAKTIADLINNGQQVGAGMIPLSTQQIAYRLQPVGTGKPTLTLEGVRPNPAHAKGLNVAFTLPTRGAARLDLLDVNGRRVLARDIGSLDPGPHTLNLAEGRTVAPGIYWVRLTQGGDQRSMRVAVVE